MHIFGFTGGWRQLGGSRPLHLPVSGSECAPQCGKNFFVGRLPGGATFIASLVSSKRQAQETAPAFSNNITVFRAMTYRSEMTKADGNMLAVTKTALERKMLGVPLRDHVNSQLSVREVTWKHIVIATVQRLADNCWTTRQSGTWGKVTATRSSWDKACWWGRRFATEKLRRIKRPGTVALGKWLLNNIENWTLTAPAVLVILITRHDYIA